MDEAAIEQAKQAQDHVLQAIVAIKENRLTEARAELDKVDALGEAVQQTTREQAKTVRGNLDSITKLQKTDLPIPTSDGGGNK